MNFENVERPLNKGAHLSSDELSFHRTELSTHRTVLSDARSHMSNERTHLAYLRTALSLMSFGITLNRFSIYLREGKLAPQKVPGLLHQTEFIGAGITILGIIILFWAIYRFRRVETAIKMDNYKSSTTEITILSIGILILGGVISLWMIFDWR